MSPNLVEAKLDVEAGREAPALAVTSLVVWEVAARGPAGPSSFFLVRPREVKRDE